MAKKLALFTRYYVRDGPCVTRSWKKVSDADSAGEVSRQPGRCISAIRRNCGDCELSAACSGGFHAANNGESCVSTIRLPGEDEAHRRNDAPKDDRQYANHP